jgi:predicted AAA+ superfamily ATPase
MSLKPWREIARPHDDVLKGNFQEAEFAADITQVAEGRASEEYQDPVKFFSRTYITEGMALLLDGVVKRLSGKGGDPVIQLQTAFGGGKTHTMLAVYHLVKGEVPVSSLAGVSPILDKAGVVDLPKANIAVIDGVNLSVNKALDHGAVQTRTLWGEMAWQLGKDEGYAMVESADKSGTSPGKETLVKLLTRFSPAVILMDELVAFMRQLDERQNYVAGSFDANLSFIQALTEGVKSAPKAVLLASLPESDTEVGGTMGQRAQDVLEQVFGRVNTIWKPVATEEAFEIVRRRLFEPIVDEEGMREVCQAFAKLYHDYADDFPTETQEALYCDRILKAYPIHPEVFDRLYEDWSSLDKFQRTRGVLQYMALIIHRLWVDDNKDFLIMPGSIPLYDHDVKNKSIYYLPQGWDPVIEKDIDGERAETMEIDKETRFGQYQAARRVARTIFLGSAPSANAQLTKGIEEERIYLGTVQPGQSINVFKDVLKRLQDRLHYLNVDNNRFWFDTRPNLRKEMEERKRRVNHQEEVLPAIKRLLTEVIRPGNTLRHIHFFSKSSDIPDEYPLRLVVLAPDKKFLKSNLSNEAYKAATEILKKRGEQQRIRQNRLLFLAPDYDQVARLYDQTKSWLAWKSIIDDVNEMRLNLDQYQVRQARQSMEQAKNATMQSLRETYRWLMAPTQFAEKGKGVGKIGWEVLNISGMGNFIQEVEAKAVDNEWIIVHWSPFFLSDTLSQWFFNEQKKEINTYELWDAFSRYLYLPRLKDVDVLKETITKGIESEDFFGYAIAKEDDEYLGFAFGSSEMVTIDEKSIIIEKERAREYKQKLLQEKADESQKTEKQEYKIPNEGSSTNGESGISYEHLSKLSSSNIRKKRFYGTIELDANMAKIDFNDIMDEIVEHFASNIDTNVKITVEIEALKPTGFDESIERTIKENCKTLKFKIAEFEEE